MRRMKAEQEAELPERFKRFKQQMLSPDGTMLNAKTPPLRTS